MSSTKLILWTIAIGTLVSSCDKNNDPDVASKEISSHARNFLTMKMGSISSNSMASASGFANAANESFDRLSVQAGISGGRIRGDSTEGADPDGTDPGEADSTYYPSPWISCAVVTTTVNEDNSVTTIYDYGDGCEEGNESFHYLMYGKYSYTYLYDNQRVGSVYKDHYAGSYSSENYGGKYYWESDTTEWNSNGSSRYSGTSEYDTANQKYKGSYEYEGDDVYSYNGLSYAYSGTGRGSYNELGSIIEMNDYSYTTPDYSYSTEVLEPLVMRYDCYNYAESAGADYGYCFMPVYVSGRESIHYNDGGVEGSFIIDYGDGTCDSKVTIIENGSNIEVDLYGLNSKG